MKKAIYLLLTAALTSCIDYSDATRELTARIQLVMPQELTQADMQGHTVVISQGGKQRTAVTDADGVAVFDGLVPDVYDISCSWELTADEYQQAAGTALNGGTSCTVSGVRNNCLVTDGNPISLTTLMGINRDILISKVYFAGSTYDGTNRGYTAGQYLELYNQSDNAIDVAGLYIALTETDNPQAFTLDNLHEAYADSVVVLKQVFRIPAGEPHTVAPGGTVLITNSAVDHSEVSTFEHDLRDADFEAKDMTGMTQNNPATPALQLVYSTYVNMSKLNFLASGLMGVVLFSTDEDMSQWTPVYSYGKTRGNMFLLLPKRYVIDGMECLANKAQTGPDVKSKRLYDDIDAGYTFINATNGKTGEVVYRKTQRRAADGHLVLTDTNNSSNDFQVSAAIGPREYDNDVQNPNE